MVELQDLALFLDLVAVRSCGRGIWMIKQAYRLIFRHRLGSEITQTHRERPRWCTLFIFCKNVIFWPKPSKEIEIDTNEITMMFLILRQFQALMFL